MEVMEQCLRATFERRGKIYSPYRLVGPWQEPERAAVEKWFKKKVGAVSAMFNTYTLVRAVEGAEAGYRRATWTARTEWFGGVGELLEHIEDLMHSLGYEKEGEG